MSVASIPPTGLHLHAIPHGPATTTTTTTTTPPKQASTTPPAILFTLTDDLIRDVQKTADTQGNLQFVTGVTPKIRLGKRTIDLTISPEAFQHELYSASTESLNHLHFTALVRHRAELKVVERKQSLGSDAALAALQNSMASYHQERAAKSVNYTGSVIATPKHRWEANNQQKHRRGLSGSQHASPSHSASATPQTGAGPTSAPSNDSELRTKAMRKAVTHLLAMKPLAREEISAKTKIPKEDVEDILSKIGKADGAGGKWGLVDRAYKDLDVWKFGYSTQEDRQAAVENAVRAYDRQRIGKEEAIWQKLLPEEKRNQGIYLSKLHIGGATSTGSGRGSGSPSDGINEDNGNGAVNGIGNGNGKAGGSTPRLGAGTPKIGTGKSDLMKKLAKKPKQRALEEAKEKKRKEREAAVAAAAAASDREGKPPPRKRVKVAGTKANANPKVKSAELVYSSSDESETGEIKESSGSTATGTATATGTSTGAGTGTGSSSSSQPKGNTKPPPLERKPAAAAAKAKTKPPPSTAAAPAAKARPVPASTRTAAATAAAAATKARTANVGKSTPRASHAAPASSRNQLSPSKPDHKPKAPSPLGPSRARVTSDVSERGALGSQRARQDSGGAETPKGLGISNVNGVRKRPETNVTSKSVGSGRTNGEARKPNAAKPSRVANGTSTSTPRASLANGGTQKVENGLKRKHLDSPIPTQENGIKHRKTDSSSTHSQRSQQSNGAGHSMDGLQRSLSSDSARSVELDYEVGVRKAEEFHEKYYPEYTRLYDQQAAMEKRGEKVPREEREKLWRLHRQLEKMKKEIREASLKEHD